MKRKIITIIFIVMIIILCRNTIAKAYTISEVVSLEEGAVGKDNSVAVNFSKDMNTTSNDKIYCISQGQHNGNANYWVLAYMEIENGVATVWDVNGLVGAQSAPAVENKILAEVLSGNYGALGYGANKNYSPTQRGLYTYWPQWIAAVGKHGLMDDSWVTGYVDNGVGASVVSKAKAAVDAGANPSVKIWMLNVSVAHAAWQDLMIAVPGASDDPGDPPPEIKSYDGYVIIDGYVWNDGNINKGNTPDGKKGGSGIENVKVTLCDSGGSAMSSTVKTDSSGYYKIIVNLQYRQNVFGLAQDRDVVHSKLKNGAYIKFEYPGKYTTVKTGAASQTNVSKAKENTSSRVSFNNSNTTVTPSSSISVSGNVTASTKGVIKLLDCTLSYPTESVTTLYCNADGSPKRMETEGALTYNGTYTETYTKNKEYWKEPITHKNQASHIVYTHEVDDLTKPIYTKDFLGWDDTKDPREPIYSEEYWTGRYEQKYCHHELCSSGHGIDNTTITNLKISNVNLGLFVVEQPDIALSADLAEVKVTMNTHQDDEGQSYIYTYNNRGAITSVTDSKFDSDIPTPPKYNRAINPADIAYINLETDDEALTVEVKYKITLANQSNTLPVTVERIIGYYDLGYDIISSNWGTQEEKSKYKKCVSKDLGIKIQPLKLATTYVTFDVKVSTLKAILKANQQLDTIFEIYKYSTQYGSGTLYAEQRKGGRNGDAYGGRDRDSQPGNAKISTGTTLSVSSNKQDDTDRAPIFVLQQGTERTISGIVWEDADANTKDNERLGNGYKDSAEKYLENVKVQLVRASDNKVAKLYTIDKKKGKATSSNAVYTDENGKFSMTGLVSDEYKIKYTYGYNVNGATKASSIKSTMIVTDAKKNTKYEISARNYKSTIIPEKITNTKGKSIENPIYEVLMGVEDDRWHLTKDSKYNISVAIDDIATRKKTTDTSLVYGNYNNKHNMVAYSIPFGLQIEFTKKASIAVNEKGNPASGQEVSKFTYNCKSFDFGIIERPRENIVIDKTVDYLKITLANGQVLTAGNPYDANYKMNYVKALGSRGIIEKRETALNSNARLVYIEVDQELIQGAKLELTYKITLTNNSEIDYEYNTGGLEKALYYHFGKVEAKDASGKTVKMKRIEKSVELVADYMDADLIYMEKDKESLTEEEKPYYTKWVKYSLSRLRNEELPENALVSKNALKTLKDDNYTIVTTTAFENLGAYDNPKTPEKENQKSVYLYASKLLANSAEDYSYDNHVEILKTNGKIARTIDSVEDKTRKPITKQYKPGTYIPNLARVKATKESNGKVNGTIEKTAGLHNQDDDMISVRITPPTGLLSNKVIYIITGIFGLALLVIGIRFIKKKVLKR